MDCCKLKFTAVFSFIGKCARKEKNAPQGLGLR